MPEVMRDVFICHASEDKPEIVRPLVKALEQEKITFWYDEAKIVVGDDIVKVINEALATSRYLVVVLSPTFIKKSFAQAELMSALYDQLSGEEVRVLPILAGSDEQRKQILDKFPLLRNRSYIAWENNPDAVVNALLQRLRPGAESVSRVCFISSEYPPRVVGGLGVHVNQLTTALGAHLDVDVVLASPDDRDGYQSPPPRVHLQPLANITPSYDEPVSWLHFANRAADRINRMARESPPDVIHCHDWVTVLAGIKCRYLLNVPLVFHLHLPNRTQLCASIENLGLVCADLITVNSEFMLEQLSSRQLGDHRSSLGRVEVVKNGVDVNEFRPCDDWPADDGYILFVGRLVKQKGVEYLLRAIYQAKEQFPDLRLKIVGMGELESALKRLCTNFMISDRVEFLDWKSGQELVRLYQKAQMVIIPSIYEPFGMTALEALACQRPVVASRVGGLQEIIQHKTTGFLAEPKDPLDLAQWIMTLLSSPDLRNEMGEAGRKFVLGNGYTWPQIARQYVQLYKVLLDKPLDKNLPEEVGTFRKQIEEVAKEADPSLSDSVLEQLFDWGV